MFTECLLSTVSSVLGTRDRKVNAMDTFPPQEREKYTLEKSIDNVLYPTQLEGKVQGTEGIQHRERLFVLSLISHQHREYSQCTGIAMDGDTW